MDKVRLGRILGAGARHAARTAVQAMDAATAPDPNPPVKRAEASAHPPRRSPEATLQSVVQTVRAVDEAKRSAKRAALAPLKKASRALWLEVTGSFFLLFSIAFAFNAAKVRDGLHAASANHSRFLLYCALTLLFGYFSVSSFLSANKR
jgi:hypothetical protein